MKIQDALAQVSKIFLDSSPVIYFVEKHPTHLVKVQDFFLALDKGSIRGFTSPVTLAECLIHPLRLGLASRVRDFRDLIERGPGVTFVSMDSAIGYASAELRAKYNLGLPDALQLACAMAAQCDGFLTNDVGLKKVASINVLVVDELTV